MPEAVPGSTGRTFTEGEAYALVQDAITRETAAATEANEGLEREKAELQNQLDVVTTERDSAVERATAAEQALEDYKAEVADERAKAELVTARSDKFKEVSSLELTEERVSRLVAMSDEQFDAYLSDLREAAALKAPANEDKPEGGDLPRASAALRGSGAPASTDDETPSVTGFWSARQNLVKNA